MSAYVIATIFLSLILLAGYLFLSHSIEKRRAQRQRLVTALRARRNTFRDLATGFPAGFLPNDLTTLLYRALVDCCDQLSRLEPKDPTHIENFNLYTDLLATQKDNGQQPRARLDNPQKIKEAQLLLQELHKFVMQQSGSKVINPVQTKAYVEQIGRLVLQMSVDSNIYNARQAQQIGKVRLAGHYYTLARKALAAENTNHGFDKQIAQLDSIITKLQEKAGSSPDAADNEAPAQRDQHQTDGTASKEWQQFATADDKWKKKQIYD